MATNPKTLSADVSPQPAILPPAGLTRAGLEKDFEALLLDRTELLAHYQRVTAEKLSLIASLARANEDFRSLHEVLDHWRHEAEVARSLNRNPPELLDGVIRRHVLAMLKAHGGNKQVTAAKLGVSRSTLYRMLESYGGAQ